MIFKIEEDSSKQDIEILLKYAVMNEDVEKLISLLTSFDIKVNCTFDGIQKLIIASDIYYVESVDKRTFVYCEKDVYETEFRLYQLIQMLSKSGFVQINKSCILNINTLSEIKSLLNSRMEATLINGERVYISRKYLSNIKKLLSREV